MSVKRPPVTSREVSEKLMKEIVKAILKILKSK